MEALSITEPEVLATTKKQLFSRPRQDSGYAVVDTQFSTDQWLDGVPISQEVTETLAPFNHVRVGSGYPDLVGAGSIASDSFRGHHVDLDSPPLVVVEAKGHGSTGQVDTETGIVQAHDRLQEANLGFLAAPRSSISPALVNRYTASGSVVSSKELKREIADAYVENLPLHEQSRHVS